ncbi:F-box only protein 28 isoform X2 [Zerene cesonia]|uniref:F-box only protein 28 isoform X2 n=1 Tax=Zerene cesonia TaxID=33412 RepID=UPI0018E4E423|nr:F-box only protein 28 isoform X2 [Zerene cesonia]
MDFLSLPVVVIENILTYLSYDEIARNRLVSKAFNDICMRMLNRGFLMIERRHALALKSVKAQLPRRESERRYHPLARHCDILTSIETRISMLNMTYSKFIDSGICCFIPGKVIDEIRRVLSIVETSKTPPRAHEVLQELRDISSMAIEHFDDKISPAFRKRLQEGVAMPPPRPSQGVLAPIAMRQEILHLRRRSILNAKLSLYLASQYKKFYKRMVEYKRIAWRQRKTIRNMNKRQRDQDSAIADLKKRIEECDIKYSELTHTNQAVGGKVIAAAAATEVLPNIKPRKPLIKLPSLSEDVSDKAESNPLPSTSNQSPRQKTQCTMAKIRGITNEIRHLSNLSKSFEGKLKRPPNSNLEETECKKQKLD